MKNSRNKGAAGEHWKPIKDYESLYEVSDLGRVRSLKRATTTGKVLKPYVSSKNGYCYVSLSKENKKCSKRIHVLVMNAFNPIEKKRGYDNAHTIDHIDGDKTNNKLQNLEWCSQSENQLRAYKTGLNAKNTRKVIDLETLEVFESLTEAAQSVGGRSANSITRVCKGKRSNYRNHHFAYYCDYIAGKIPEFAGKSKRSCEKLWR